MRKKKRETLTCRDERKLETIGKEKETDRETKPDIRGEEKERETDRGLGDNLRGSSRRMVVTSPNER